MPDTSEPRRDVTLFRVRKHGLLRQALPFGAVFRPNFHLCTKDYARFAGAVNRKLDEREFPPLASTLT